MGPWVPDWVVYYKTDTWDTDWVISGLILTLVFMEPWVPDWVVSYKTDTW